MSGQTRPNSVEMIAISCKSLSVGSVVICHSKTVAIVNNTDNRIEPRDMRKGRNKEAQGRHGWAKRSGQYSGLQAALGLVSRIPSTPAERRVS